MIGPSWVCGFVCDCIGTGESEERKGFSGAMSRIELDSDSVSRFLKEW